MKIEGVNPKTGQKVEVETRNIGNDFIKYMNDFEMSDEGVKRLIDNLNISADAKALFYSFTDATIRVGEYIIKIGRKIIEIVYKICQEFPTASFLFLLGVIAGLLVSLIPIIGAVLSPILLPLFSVLGLVIGTLEDIKDRALKRKIEEITSSFEPLGAGR